MSARDVVVTVPKDRWLQWLAEGDLPGDPTEESIEWGFYLSSRPHIESGARCYVVAFGRLRGYAPALRAQGGAIVRGGGAVACTIPRRIEGFRGHRFRDWDRGEEQPFPDWATAGLPMYLADEVSEMLAARRASKENRVALRAWALGEKP